ncbi:hypothetical protein N7450_004612 [Penicillium hetheringtonii]|uniref:Major facilitator superfamily (MFS) profile domain-containing protein n=1 Tax=Penicillium hetheringtonii TaxID=911720 RepID=A0AAD6GVW4_9EURO|nr:hypothetical protein N7450_004612 [Penicillium hetheringtonii]
MEASLTNSPDCLVPFEKGHLHLVLEDNGLEFTPDGGFIRWSASNKKHPRNWHMPRKIYDSSLIIFLDFFTYLIGQCLGGIIFPSFSEAFGRKLLYIISTGLYSIFCVIVGVVPSLAGVAVGRFFSGFLSAIPTIVVAGSIEDLYNSKDRIWMIFLWAMVANMGMCVGPIISTYLAEHLGWQWVFHFAAIVTGVVSFLLIGIRESRPSMILGREVAKIRNQTGIDTLKALNPDHTPDLRTFMRVALFRPIQLFFTEPIVFLVSMISAIAFAMVYLFTEALPPVYQSMGFSNGTSTLPFLAICIGLVAGFLTRIKDYRKITSAEEQNLVLEPEDKLFGFCIGAPMLACGLWWFAWTIPPIINNVHWIVSAISLVLIGFSLNEFDAVLGGYLADSYLSFSASGFATLALLRSLLSAAFPLFASDMFEGLGANVAASILAGLATLFCIVPPLFTKYGRQIRARSKFARYSLQVYHENSVEKSGL